MEIPQVSGELQRKRGGKGNKDECSAVDFRRYIVLGACNPPLAYKMLQEEISIGLLLPCKVVVYEADEVGRSMVAAVDEQAILSVVGSNPRLHSVATEVNEKLKRVVTQL